MYAIRFYNNNPPNNVLFEDDGATLADTLSILEHHLSIFQRDVVIKLIPGSSYSATSCVDVDTTIYVMCQPDINEIDWEELYKEYVKHASIRPKDVSYESWSDKFWNDRGGIEVFFKVDGFGMNLRREYKKLKGMPPELEKRLGGCMNYLVTMNWMGNILMMDAPMSSFGVAKVFDTMVKWTFTEKEKLLTDVQQEGVGIFRNDSWFIKILKKEQE